MQTVPETGELVIVRRVDVVSASHPRFQCYVAVRHPSISDDVLWVRGPKRFTRKGAERDLPDASAALAQRLVKERRQSAGTRSPKAGSQPRWWQL